MSSSCTRVATRTSRRHCGAAESASGGRFQAESGTVPGTTPGMQAAESWPCWYGADDAGVACLGEIYNAHELCRQLDLTAERRCHACCWRHGSAGRSTAATGSTACSSLALRMATNCSSTATRPGCCDLYYCSGRNGQLSFASHLDSPAAPVRHSSAGWHGARCTNTCASATSPRRTRSSRACAPSRPGNCCAGRPRHRVARAVPDARASADVAGRLRRRRGRRSTPACSAACRSAWTTRARPAAFLSGGIDSSLICALASRQRADTTAVTVGFDGARATTRRRVAARIAAHLGMRHEVLRFEPRRTTCAPSSA